MSNRIPQTQAELQAHLQEQIGFLERSADSFDAGYTDEAKRIALTIRLILHDTSKSHSLLSQLGMKGIKFCDSSNRPMPGDLVNYAGLAYISVDRDGVKHAACLDGDDPSRFR